MYKLVPYMQPTTNQLFYHTAQETHRKNTSASTPSYEWNGEVLKPGLDSGLDWTLDWM